MIMKKFGRSLVLMLILLLLMTGCDRGNNNEVTNTETGIKIETEGEPTVSDVVEDIELAFDTPMIYLKTGETFQITGSVTEDKYVRYTFMGGGGDSATVATVTGNVIEAKSPGNVILRAENPYNGNSAEMSVRVQNGKDDPTVVVCAPVWSANFLDDKQMTYIRDAGFTHVAISDGNTDAQIVKALALCEKYGVKLIPPLTSPKIFETDMTRAQIEARINKFKVSPAFGGFCLKDEPAGGFDAFARTAQTVYEIDPSLLCMINFLPNASYDAVTDFAAQLYDHDFKGIISFDNYIFGPAAGNVSEFWLYRNFEMYRDISAKNRVRWGFYLQSIGSDYYGYRRPDEGTMFYHGMLGMAYGSTIMRYFSYPTPNTQEYTDGVIGYDTDATDLYPVACALNEKCIIYGRVLLNALPTEIYHTGRMLDPSADYETVPDDYFITCRDDKARTVISLFTDRYTGQNYLMLVNKDFERGIETTYDLKGVPYLFEVDEKDGSYKKLDVADGTLSVSLSKGNARLYILPYNIRYTTDITEEKQNLLEGSYLTVSSSAEVSGFCSRYLIDGIRLSNESSVGWRSADAENISWARFDMGMKKTFNRLDLYPAGNGVSCGRYMPGVIKLMISEDGVNWTVVKEVKPESPDLTAGYSVTFEPVTSQYVMLEFKELPHPGSKYVCSFSEICLYNDDGSISAPDKTDYCKVNAEPGANIALGKSVCDYSSIQTTREWNLMPEFLTDGKRGSKEDQTRYSTGISHNGSSKAVEFFTLDLGATYTVDRIELYPFYTGAGFPVTYTVDISEDGENWTTVSSVVGAAPNDGTPVIINFEAQEAGYVRLYATVLTLEPNPNAGYVIQICEMEVYTPSK